MSGERTSSSSNAPLVSVIIPTHNPSAELNKAVDSVLAQDVDLELIIVDDGSEVDIASLLGERLKKVRLISQARK